MNLLLSNKTYDILKKLVVNVLPAVATLIFALASVWSIPYAEQIVGTITAVCTFIGALIGVSASNYKKVNSDED